MNYILTQEELDRLRNNSAIRSEYAQILNIKLLEFSKELTKIISSHPIDSSKDSYYSLKDNEILRAVGEAMRRCNIPLTAAPKQSPGPVTPEK